MSSIVDCQLFPCVTYIKILSRHTHIKIEKYENFQKMSFRNRYIVSGANSAITLSIPIVGGREQKTLITEVRINNATNWQLNHWRTLLSAYSKAPFFEFYSQDIKALIFSGEDFLFSLNIKILTWLCNALKINAVIEFTDQFIAHYENDLDYRNHFLPKSFQENTINWLPKYPQVFEDRLGFQPNLSILDLMFCQGPNSIHLLNQSR